MITNQTPLVGSEVSNEQLINQAIIALKNEAILLESMRILGATALALNLCVELSRLSNASITELARRANEIAANERSKS